MKNYNYNSIIITSGNTYKFDAHNIKAIKTVESYIATPAVVKYSISQWGEEDFLSAPIVVKHNIVYLSSLPRALAYESFSTGQVSAKAVLALAQVFHVTPYYYTGETDDKLPLEKTTLLSFLQEHGYTALYETLKDAEEEKYNYTSLYSFLSGHEINLAERQHLENQNLMDTPFWEKHYGDEIATIKLKLSNSYDLHEHITELTEDEATNLLKSLYIRGKSDNRAGLVLELIYKRRKRGCCY